MHQQPILKAPPYGASSPYDGACNQCTSSPDLVCQESGEAAQVLRAGCLSRVLQCGAGLAMVARKVLASTTVTCRQARARDEAQQHLGTVGTWKVWQRVERQGPPWCQSQSGLPRLGWPSSSKWKAAATGMGSLMPAGTQGRSSFRRQPHSMLCNSSLLATAAATICSHRGSAEAACQARAGAGSACFCWRTQATELKCRHVSSLPVHFMPAWNAHTRGHKQLFCSP